MTLVSDFRPKSIPVKWQGGNVNQNFSTISPSYRFNTNNVFRPGEVKHFSASEIFDYVCSLRDRVCRNNQPTIGLERHCGPNFKKFSAWELDKYKIAGKVGNKPTPAIGQLLLVI
jgi:hypothetical protein